MKEPKIGLALGSGGARGFAHLGVLKVLDEENIPVDMIAGSSMGALIGAFYCTGTDINKLYRIATAFRRKYYLDFTVPKMGFVSGNKVKEFIKIFTKGKNIEELYPPLSIVATDLKNGEKIVFNKGPVAQAVRASISMPGIFVPEKIDGRLFIDGGVVDRVPVSIVRDMGADIVLAVDVSYYKAETEITSILDVIMQSIDIMQDELAHYGELDADIMLKPNVEKFSSKSFTNIKDIIQIGEEATRKKVPIIKEIVKSWKELHHG